jgi:hypothetical protein
VITGRVIKGVGNRTHGETGDERDRAGSCCQQAGAGAAPGIGAVALGMGAVLAAGGGAAAAAPHPGTAEIISTVAGGGRCVRHL